jgi:hypothetical protein
MLRLVPYPKRVHFAFLTLSAKYRRGWMVGTLEHA